MSDWKEYKLGEVYDFASGLSKNAKEFGFGHPFLSFKEVFHNYFLPKKLVQLANTTKSERERCSIKKGDVFLTRTSETQEELGMSSVALNDYPDATFNGFTKRLRPQKDNLVHPQYAGFFFRSPRFRATITSMASITTRASLNNGMLSDLTITLPPMSEQKAIAGVLSSLDDKIDLLHHQNKTLEQMAETLFRYYFIENAKASWKQEPLSNIAQFLNGLACQRYLPENLIDKLPVLKIKELREGISENSDWARSTVEPAYIVHNGDVIFSWSASLMVKIWDGKDCVLNQHLFKVTSLKYPKWFFYGWCKYHLAEFISISSSHATTMGHIKRSDLDAATVLVPSVSEMEEMTGLMEPLLNKVILNNRQISILEGFRDSLLPKLVGGEIKIRA